MSQCKSGKSLLTGENDTLPGKAPLVLTRITPIEEYVISIIGPSVAVHKTVKTLINWPVLPHDCHLSVNSSNELMFTIICIRRKVKLIVLYCIVLYCSTFSHHCNEASTSITNKNFHVNRQHLINALTFLKDNSDDFCKHQH